MPSAERPVSSGPPATLAGSRLAALKAGPHRLGQAAFFFHDAHFGSDAVKVLPGEYFVYHEDILIMTTLGSCIAVCLWDRQARVGGMNHFMLATGDAASGRYGSYAMELLINEMMRRGANRPNLEAKVFGGGQVIDGMTMDIGERNTAFALEYLRAERIAIVSKDVLGVHPRKVCFLPASGKAMVKRLGAASAEALAAQERLAAQRAVPAGSGAGTVDLF